MGSVRKIVGLGINATNVMNWIKWSGSKIPLHFYLHVIAICILFGALFGRRMSDYLLPRKMILGTENKTCRLAGGTVNFTVGRSLDKKFQLAMMKKKEAVVVGDKWLADAISYKEDIEPYQFIKIFAGVGSGKNTFIDKLVNGYMSVCRDGSEYEVERKFILQITSRRAKVNEQLESNEVVYDPRVGLFDKNSNAVFWLDDKYEDYYESPMIELPHLGGWGQQMIYKRSCACTNAKIEYYIKNQYEPLDLTTHPWERFDMIVIDEVHSLLADASYQSAPFYVRQLIKETLKCSKTCKVVVMTGTPEILADDPLFKDAHELNLMEECVNLTPSKLVYVDSEWAKKKYLAMLRDGEKAIYFANHISRVMAMVKEAPVETLDHVAVSFSDLEKREALKEKYGNVTWDDSGNIGKRYRKQDEIGTPHCVVIDFDTLEDDTVTVRDRDTAAQVRIKTSEL